MIRNIRRRGRQHRGRTCDARYQKRTPQPAAPHLVMLVLPFHTIDDAMGGLV
jgi:hypothetical protein